MARRKPWPLPDPIPREDRTFGSGLYIDLIPRSSWYSNARSAMRPETWKRVSLAVRERADMTCEVCGAIADPANRQYHAAHERWDFDETTRSQTLRRLMCLCDACHAATHYGHTELEGDVEAAQERLMALNGWDELRLLEHIDRAFEVWRRRSAAEWRVDVSMLRAAGVPLIVQAELT